jgi:hypothetical protein
LEVAVAIQRHSLGAPRGLAAKSTRWFVPIAATVLVLGLASAAPEAAPSTGVRATFGAPIRREDGHVNVRATLRRLQRLHANAYAFLVKETTDWQDLLSFAPKAQTRGLEVWVYLVPPGGCLPKGDKTCSGYFPFHADYVAWARAIAKLSRRYPVVTAWVMDDFAPPPDARPNEVFFTPAYMRRIREAVRRVQPRLKFYPVVYYDRIDALFVHKYAKYFVALIMPFRDDPYRNNLMTDTLDPQLKQALTLLEPTGRELILMVYANPLSSRGATPATRKITIPPDVDYVRKVTSVGLRYSRAGTIAGVIQYVLPLTPDQPQISDVPARTGKGTAVVTVDGGTATSTGNWAEALTWIALDSGSTSCRMRVWHSDNRRVPSLRGYHFKQVLVAGRKIWERDVARDGTAWYRTRRLEVGPLLARGPARLILRLYEKAGVSNYPVRVRFDDVTLTGCHTKGDPGFERRNHAWTYVRRGGPVIAGVHTGPVLAGHHTYDRTYSTTVFKAVAALYAP